MAEPALNWKNLSVSEKITKGRAIVEAMGLSAYFALPNPVPNPTLASITLAINALEQAQQDVDENMGGKKWTNIRDQKEKALDKLMSQITNYVANVANGNSEIIQAAAIELKKEASPVGALPAPQNVKAKPTDTEGKIKLTWKKVDKAASYKVRRSEDVTPKVWQDYPNNTSTDTKVEISGLTSGTKFWWQVVAINASGEGDPSDPATCRVP